MTEPAKPLPPAADRYPWATHVLIPTQWMSEQALAVFKLLDDLRQAVASLYIRQIQNLLRQEQGHGDAADRAAGGEHLTDDPPF